MIVCVAIGIPGLRIETWGTLYRYNTKRSEN